MHFLQVCRYRKCLEAGMKPDKVDAGWPKRSAPQDHHQEENNSPPSAQNRSKKKPVRRPEVGEQNNVKRENDEEEDINIMPRIQPTISGINNMIHHCFK